MAEYVDEYERDPFGRTHTCTHCGDEHPIVEAFMHQEAPAASRVSLGYVCYNAPKAMERMRAARAAEIAPRAPGPSTRTTIRKF